MHLLFFFKQNGDGERIEDESEDGDDESENFVFFLSSLSLKSITSEALKLDSSSKDEDDKDTENKDWESKCPMLR